MLYTAIIYPKFIEIKGSYINEAGLRPLGMMGGSALRSVEFEYVDTTDGGIEVLCKRNPGLKRMSLTLTSESTVTDEGVRSIAKYCPGLEQISLVGWKDISNRSLEVLCTLPRLEETSLSYCKGVTSAGIASLVKSIGGNLEVLKLCSVLDLTSASFLPCDDKLLQYIGECCPKLRELTMDTRTTDNITEATFATLFQGCPLLEALECTQLPAYALPQLAKHCPCLRKLDVFEQGCTNAGIVAVASKCTKLMQLRLDYAQQLTDESILSLAKHCPSLERLFLVEPKLITDHAICQLFKSCTQLTVLGLYNTPLITERSLLTLQRWCPRLKEVTLYNLTAVTQVSIVALTCFDSTLESLKIESCRSLSDDAVALISERCTVLKCIKLVSCPLVTVQALIELLTHGKRLTYIKLNRCGVVLTSEIEATHLTRRPTAQRTAVLLDGSSYIV